MSTVPPATPSTSRPTGESASTRPGVDPRGPRFAAAVTTLVLSVALVLASPILLALQTLVFAVGALLGPARQPYGAVFRRVIRPRLSAPTHLEDPAAPRFAQVCGLAFGVVGLLGFALGLTGLALAAIALALGAAFLNAVFDYCLGCEFYVRAQRLRHP